MLIKESQLRSLIRSELFREQSIILGRKIIRENPSLRKLNNSYIIIESKMPKKGRGKIASYALAALLGGTALLAKAGIIDSGAFNQVKQGVQDNNTPQIAQVVKKAQEDVGAGNTGKLSKSEAEAQIAELEKGLKEIQAMTRNIDKMMGDLGLPKDNQTNPAHSEFNRKVIDAHIIDHPDLDPSALLSIRHPANIRNSDGSYMSIGQVIEAGYTDREIQMMRYRQNNPMPTR